MKKTPLTRCQKRWRALLLITLIYIADSTLSPYPELVVEIGGTYEDMAIRSSAKFNPLFPHKFWWGDIESPAKFRLFDPKYGFTAPAGPALYITFDDYNIVQRISLYPHMKPLTLDKLLETLLDLQSQWQAAGWFLCDSHKTEAFADTPQWRDWIRNARNGIDVSWQAEHLYQARVLLNRRFSLKDPDITPDLETYQLRVDVAKVRPTYSDCEKERDRPDAPDMSSLSEPSGHDTNGHQKGIGA